MLAIGRLKPVAFGVLTLAVDAECGDDPRPRPSVRTYRASYRWNSRAGRFITTSPQLKRLDRLNQADF